MAKKILKKFKKSKKLNKKLKFSINFKIIFSRIWSVSSSWKKSSKKYEKIARNDDQSQKVKSLIIERVDWFNTEYTDTFIQTLSFIHIFTFFILERFEAKLSSGKTMLLSVIFCIRYSFYRFSKVHDFKSAKITLMVCSRNMAWLTKF